MKTHTLTNASAEYETKTVLLDPPKHPDAHTVMCTRFTAISGSHPLAREGFGQGTILFSVLIPGDCASDYDPYRLSRQASLTDFELDWLTAIRRDWDSIEDGQRITEELHD